MRRLREQAPSLSPSHAEARACFGPTGTDLAISVHRVYENVAAAVVGDEQRNEERQLPTDRQNVPSLCAYRIEMSIAAHSSSDGRGSGPVVPCVSVLYMLHAALLQRANKIDESAWKVWRQLLTRAAANATAVASVSTTSGGPGSEMPARDLQALYCAQVMLWKREIHSSSSAATSSENMSVVLRNIQSALRQADDQATELRDLFSTLQDGKSLRRMAAGLYTQSARLLAILRSLRTMSGL